MDRESLELLALSLFAIVGFFLFALLLALLELDQLLPTPQSKPALSKSSENSAPISPPTYTNPFGTLRALPFRLLQDATSNFSHSNLLHAGPSAQTFVGSLQVDVQEEELPVVAAVKRFEPSSITSPSAPDHYTAELHIHSNVTHLMQSFLLQHGHHHPHSQFIAPLLGYCVEGQERLLVYKYAGNRDLSTALALSSFCWNNVTTCLMPYVENLLPWITRLKIAIRVAEALAFLHHTCQPGIAHRDVKASGILLTEDFDVWLGSLSEARTLEEGELPLYDIYCFGKLLLHLISGLNITEHHLDDVEEDSSAHHPPWMLETLPLINYQMKLDSFLKLVDPSMVLDDDENLVREVLGVAILAKACLDSTTLENLSMLTILHFLQNPLDLLKEPFEKYMILVH